MTTRVTVGDSHYDSMVAKAEEENPISGFRRFIIYQSRLFKVYRTTEADGSYIYTFIQQNNDRRANRQLDKFYDIEDLA